MAPFWGSVGIVLHSSPLRWREHRCTCPGLLWTPMWGQVGDRYARDNPAYEGMTARQVFDAMIEERIPMKKEQTPEDVADTVAFFVSDDAKNITGQALNVDGGFFMR